MQELSIDEIIDAKDLKALLKERIHILHKSSIKDEMKKFKIKIRDFNPLTLIDNENLVNNEEIIKEMKDNYRMSYFKEESKKYF